MFGKSLDTNTYQNQIMVLKTQLNDRDCKILEIKEEIRRLEERNLKIIDLTDECKNLKILIAGLVCESEKDIERFICNIDDAAEKTNSTFSKTLCLISRIMQYEGILKISEKCKNARL